MKIPPADTKQEKARRLDFYQTLIQKCFISRVERRQTYTQNRFYYLYGTDGSYENEDKETGLGPPPGNKIYPHVDQLASFLYAQDTTRFSVEIGAAVKKEMQQWTNKLGRYVNDEWHTSNSDVIYGVALRWALVYGWTAIKPLWKRNTIVPYICLPHNFGVLREDEGMLSRQEAFVQHYTITESQLTNEYSEHPRFAQIKKRIMKRGQGMSEATTGIDRIIMSAQDPLGAGGSGGGGVGVVDWLAQISMNYVPRVQEELIDMYELYVWDDDLKDYRIVTLADPAVVLFDRALKVTGWIDHDQPFKTIVPNPDPNYFWGMAEVERLVPLQTYRNRCMAQIEHLQELQAHPPMTSVGFSMDQLEMQYALDTPSGLLTKPDAEGQGGNAAKADRVKIELPNDLYMRIEWIDKAIADMSGLQDITQGKGVSGVRSAGHAAELAKLGSSRAKARALIIEDSLEDLATTYLKLLRRYDDKHLQTALGEEFVADQFTDDFVVKVDAHSNSPIFMDDLTTLAFQLFKAKAITRERLLQMVQVPMREQLIADLHDQIEPAEKKEAEDKMKLERERFAERRGGRPPKTAGA